MLRRALLLLLPLAWAGLAAAEPALAAAAATKATAVKPPEATISLMDLLRLGGAFMWPIYLISVVGVTLVIERASALRLALIIPTRFVEGLVERVKTGRSKDDLLDFCHADPSPIARVAAAGIRKFDRDIETVEQAIEDAGANEVSKLRRNLRLLFGVASVAPMLGLLGTVWGMIIAFKTTTEAGLGAQQLADGIYQALITTLAGLCVAIPVLVAYFLFQARIERLVSRMNDVCLDLVLHVERGRTANPANQP